MKAKSWIIITFLLTSVLQLIVIGKVIYDKESILKIGEVYKFDLAPVDPHDLFRGKYIDLRFNVDTKEAKPENTLIQDGFVVLGVDSLGFAKVVSVQETPPDEGEDYIICDASCYNGTWNINFPFDRYYMEESKALPAEMMYRNARRRGAEMEAYALIAVHKGQGIIKSVMINDEPIEEAVLR